MHKYFGKYFSIANDVELSQSHNTLIYIQIGYWAFYIGYRKEALIRIELFTPRWRKYHRIPLRLKFYFGK